MTEADFLMTGMICLLQSECTEMASDVLDKTARIIFFVKIKRVQDTVAENVFVEIVFSAEKDSV
jgi:hypothetical protein